MLKSGIYDFVICRGGTDMCFVLGFGRQRPDLKQYRISGLTDGIRLSCCPDTIPARAKLGHPTPYLQGHPSVQVPTVKCNQEELLSMIHLRWFDRGTSGMN